MGMYQGIVCARRVRSKPQSRYLPPTLLVRADEVDRVP